MTDWTSQQQAFFSFLDSCNQSCILKAAAGSGKTTTLVEGVKHLRGSVLAIAFNVKIKKELESCIGSSAVCKTLNGVGHRALVNMMGHRVGIEQDKIFKIIKRIVDSDKRLGASWGSASQLVSRARHNGLVPKGTPGQWTAFLEDTEENWADLAAHHGIDFDREVLELARKTLRQSNTLTWKGQCDYDDQIYVPCCFGGQFDKFDNVIVDEAQDLSILQHRVVKKSLKPGGRVVAAGDENQAIYGWRSAASDSIDRLIETFSLEELDLTVSFRCGRAIIDVAQRIVPRIEARPDAHEGEVKHLAEFSPANFSHGDVVLCRNNGPIIQLAYRLITSGTPCFVIGRDIGKGLKALVKKLQSRYSFTSAEQLAVAATEWREVETNRLSAVGKYSQIQPVHDKADSLLAIISGSGAQTVQEVLDRIDQLFNRKTGKVALSTVHRAKGLEWSRVFFLDPQLIPSVWALKALERDPIQYEWMRKEEDNIFYVAVTRAIDQLIYIDSEGWRP